MHRELNAYNIIKECMKICEKPNLTNNNKNIGYV